MMTSKQTAKKMWWGGAITVAVSLSLVLLFTSSLQPSRALGGVVWLKHGIHYLSDAEVNARVEQLNAPKEAVIVEKVKVSTSLCDSVEGGFCQKSQAEYAFKTLVTPAVAYSPGTPDRKVIIGYCTACNDGSFSPSCAVGRGACSYHAGVAAYNVPQYKTIPGTPAIQAVAAVYSYAPRSYKDSPIYTSPEVPSLGTIVGY